MVVARIFFFKCRRHIFFDSCPDLIHTVLKKKMTLPRPPKSLPFKKKKKGEKKKKREREKE